MNQVAGAAAAGFAVDSDRQLRAVVSGAAGIGPVVVTTAAGTEASAWSFATTLPRLIVPVSGSGSVVFDPPGGTYAPGTLVTVTAIPAPGFDFAGWTGDLAGLPNPAAVTMDADHDAIAHFEPLPADTTSLDVFTQGPGSVSWSPSGRLHPLGSSVTLAATPDPSAVFLGWSGDLAGSDNPATVVMSTSRSVTGRFTRSGLTIEQEDYEKGSSSELASVSTDDAMPAVAGDLYLAAVTARPRVDTLQVSGLGLAWSELVEQCTRQGHSAVSLWWALGVPSGEGPVTATLGGVATNATLVVTRYSGVDAAQPLGPLPNLVAGNANGIDGACSGGVDTELYSLPITTGAYESMMHAAIASNARHSPGDDWREITERRTGSGPLLAGLAAMEQAVDSPSTISVEGELSDEGDWAVAAVEIHRQQLLSPVVSAFSPASGPVGTVVTVLGNGFGGAQRVEFGGVAAESFVVDTRAQLRAEVPAGAIAGPIVVTTSLGSGSTEESFLVTNLATCSDGLDNDGDGAADHPDDLGCSDPQDDSERSSVFACDNGLDDDGDGLADAPQDPGCQLAISPREDPPCDDGLDNDGDGTVDWDGGPGGGVADESCGGTGWGTEDGPLCGIGWELGALLSLLARWRARGSA